jgi:hypothetical protein
LRRALWVLLVAPVLAAPARATERVPLRSYWDDGGSAIYTDVMVLHDDGRAEVVRELGGSVDGIAMIQFTLYARAPGEISFVPTLNSTDARLRWSNSWVFLTPDRAGAPDVPGEGEMEALETALGVWNASVEGCSYMRFVLKDREPLEVGLDGKNTVKFRGEKWCRPARGDTPEKCYDAGATAITTLFFVDRESRPDNGMILDADIEINSVDYAMAVGCESRCVTDARTGIVEDLQNTLTHELGHVLGLDHTCWPFEEEEPPLHHDGTPAPLCRPISSLPQWVIEATMYNYQEPRETKKRTPEQDDVMGICTIYALADDPKLYTEVDVSTGAGCCAVAGGGAGRRGAPAGILVFLAAATWLFGRKLRARACSRTRRP